MNRLFVANKPINISSNRFLGQLKKKYKVKSAGFSGTLDPFASGCLIIAFGAYTKLFNYINQAPKCYEATIWLGAKSASLDNENIEKISILEPFLLEDLQNFTNQLIGKIEFTPPKYSAKHINGARAYDLARKGIDFELKTQKMQVFSAQILNYSHPFLTISLKLSQGGYARSWAELLAKKLNCDATLSALKRISEGDFFYENEKALNPLDFLKLNKNKEKKVIPRVKLFNMIISKPVFLTVRYCPKTKNNIKISIIILKIIVFSLKILKFINVALVRKLKNKNPNPKINELAVIRLDRRFVLIFAFGIK